MISILLSRKFCASFIGDPVAKHRALSFELAGFVLWVNPVGDTALLLSVRLQRVRHTIEVFGICHGASLTAMVAPKLREDLLGWMCFITCRAL